MGRVGLEPTTMGLKVSSAAKHRASPQLAECSFAGCSDCPSSDELFLPSLLVFPLCSHPRGLGFGLRASRFRRMATTTEVHLRRERAG
jgi:hypothetical protein